MSAFTLDAIKSFLEEETLGIYLPELESNQKLISNYFFLEIAIVEEERASLTTCSLDLSFNPNLLSSKLSHQFQCQNIFANILK